MISHRKTAFLITLILILTSKLYATGAGAHAGIKPVLFISDDGIKSGGVMATVSGSYRLGRFPLVMGTSIEAGLNQEGEVLTGLSAFADYWIFDLQIKNTWNFYTGLGATVGVLTPDFNYWNLYAGARVFSGMNWLFYDNYLELFVQQNVVPTYQKGINCSSDNAVFTLLFPLELGIRFHF